MRKRTTDFVDRTVTGLPGELSQRKPTFKAVLARQAGLSEVRSSLAGGRPTLPCQ